MAKKEEKEVVEIVVEGLEEYFLMYGPGEDGDRAHIYSRYAMGDSLEQIAHDCDMSVGEILAIMRKRPAEYKETREKREMFERLRVHRSLSLIDGINLATLEGIREGTVSLDKDMMLHLSKAVKELANRHALNEGKLTANVGITEQITEVEMRRRMAAQDAAGHGLAVDDIGEVEREE